WNGRSSDRFDWDGTKLLLPFEGFLFDSVPDGRWILWLWEALTRGIEISLLPSIPIEPLAVLIITVDTTIRKVLSKIEFICDLPMVGIFVDEPICTPLRAILEVTEVLLLILDILNYGVLGREVVALAWRVRQSLIEKIDFLNNAKNIIRNLPIDPSVKLEAVYWINEAIKLLTKILEIIAVLIPIATCVLEAEYCLPYYFADWILRLLGQLPTVFISYQQLCAYPCIDEDVIDRLCPQFSPQVKNKILRELRLAHSKVCHCTILDGCEDDPTSDPRIPDREITCDDCENCYPGSRPSNELEHWQVTEQSFHFVNPMVRSEGEAQEICAHRSDLKYQKSGDSEGDVYIIYVDNRAIHVYTKSGPEGTYGDWELIGKLIGGAGLKKQVYEKLGIRPHR
ncbi:MAG: hypothetical protein CV045_13670, partial [Cyanobacteria bacterium M5B4]